VLLDNILTYILDMLLNEMRCLSIK